MEPTTITKGPWIVGPNLKIYGSGIPVQQPSGSTITVKPLICTATTLADARLIAAAPELLSALIDCQKRLALLMDSGRGKMLDAVAEQKAVATIVKARGY